MEEDKDKEEDVEMTYNSIKKNDSSALLNLPQNKNKKKYSKRPSKDDSDIVQSRPT